MYCSCQILMKLFTQTNKVNVNEKEIVAPQKRIRSLCSSFLFCFRFRVCLFMLFFFLGFGVIDRSNLIVAQCQSISINSITMKAKFPEAFMQIFVRIS